MNFAKFLRTLFYRKAPLAGSVYIKVEVNLGTCQASIMELFVKMINSFSR